MLTPLERKANYAQPEKLRKLRIRNLQKLAELFGWQELARRTGMTYEQLDQLAGEHPVRVFNDHYARSIEMKVGLGPGWLDRKESDLTRHNAV